MSGKDVRIGACLLAGNMECMVRFYRDTLGFHTKWDGGDFAEFETASGELSLFMYSRKAFVQAIVESYVPPKESIRPSKLPFGCPALLMWMQNMSVYRD